MSILCTNCKAVLSCGCQKRKASNGAAVCTVCIGPYEAKIKGLKFVPPPTALTNTDNKPTGIQVLYNGPSK